MKKTKLLAWAVVAAIGGLAMTSTASATATVTHYPDSDVEYTLNGTDFTAWTITITEWGDTITILDRNLWANQAGTGCEDPSWEWNCPANDPTYWYHFQWWNNYGFDPNTTPTIWQQITTSIEYNPFYTDSVFRVGNSNWLSENSVVDLWWWSTDDYIEEINWNNWQVSNGSDRQWPCPEWFHVPSYGELLKIKTMMGDDASAIHNDLLVPFAGTRGYYDAEVYSLGSYANLWSSSPYSAGSSNSRYLGLTVDWRLSMYYDYRAYAYSLRCIYDSYQTYTKAWNLSSEPIIAQITLNVVKGNLTIWTTTWNLNLWEVNVSNSAQELSWSFGADSFWVEDMKWLETGYYTTISVTNLTWTVATHVISANNVYLKTAWETPSYITWATVSDSKVVFSNDIKSWHNNWAEPVTYFNRQNTPSNLAWRVWKWWDNLQIKVNIPAHTPYDTYRWTITYTLYDLDS